MVTSFKRTYAIHCVSQVCCSKSPCPCSRPLLTCAFTEDIQTLKEISGVIGKFGLGVQNEAGQRLTEFCQENALVIETPSSNNTRDDSTHRHHQMVNTEITLIIFFAAKDGETLYGQQKQDREMIVAQIMNSLLPNSD